MGRPSKRTPEAAEAILAALAEGHTKSAAAAAGGMHYDTLNEWVKAEPEFSDAVEKAEGDAKRKLLGEVARDKSWQAKAWILERRWPKEFGRREAVEMSGPDGGPIDTRDLSTVPDHERAALAAAIRAHLRGEEEPARDAEVAGEG